MLSFHYNYLLTSVRARSLPILLFCAIMFLLLGPASSMDLCAKSTFESPLSLLTIGTLSNRLLLITTDFTIYEMPFNALHAQCLHLYQASSYVPMTTKWPQLSNSNLFRKMAIKNAIVTRFTPNLNTTSEALLFAAWNATSSTAHLTTLTYYLDSSSTLTKFEAAYRNETINGVWLSSDELETFYSLYNNELVKVENVIFNNENFIIDMDITRFYICNTTEIVDAKVRTVISEKPCKRSMNWTGVRNGFRHSNIFYLFGLEEVYSFNALQAFNQVPAIVSKLSYDQFILCSKRQSHDPIIEPESSNNASSSAVSFFKGTHKSYLIAFTVMGIIIVALVIALLTLLALFMVSQSRCIEKKLENKSANKKSKAKVLMDEYYY